MSDSHLADPLEKFFGIGWIALCFWTLIISMTTGIALGFYLSK